MTTSPFDRQGSQPFGPLSTAIFGGLTAEEIAAQRDGWQKRALQAELRNLDLVAALREGIACAESLQELFDWHERPASHRAVGNSLAHMRAALAGDGNEPPTSESTK